MHHPCCAKSPEILQIGAFGQDGKVQGTLWLSWNRALVPLPCLKRLSDARLALKSSEESEVRVSGPPKPHEVIMPPSDVPCIPIEVLRVSDCWCGHGGTNSVNELG